MLTKEQREEIRRRANAMRPRERRTIRLGVMNVTVSEPDAPFVPLPSLDVNAPNFKLRDAVLPLLDRLDELEREHAAEIERLKSVHSDSITAMQKERDRDVAAARENEDLAIDVAREATERANANARAVDCGKAPGAPACAVAPEARCYTCRIAELQAAKRELHRKVDKAQAMILRAGLESAPPAGPECECGNQLDEDGNEIGPCRGDEPAHDIAAIVRAEISPALQGIYVRAGGTERLLVQASPPAAAGERVITGRIVGTWPTLTKIALPVHLNQRSTILVDRAEGDEDGREVEIAIRAAPSREGGR